MSESNGLPKGWAEATIERLVGDGVFCDGDWVESEDQDPNGDIRLIQLADVGDGEYRDRSSRFLTSAKAKELNCTFLQEGDLLIARMPDPLGRSALFPGDAKPSVTVVDVCIVRSGSKACFSHKWLMHFINSPRFRVSVAGLQSGSTRKRISRRNLASLSLPIPPLPEQNHIVEKIEELFSDLDAGVKALERAKANLKRYRASVLKSAVEGRLTEEWRKEHPQSEDGGMLLDRILRERREKWEKDQLLKFREKGKEPPKNWQSKYEEPSHEAGLYELPSCWIWASALEICDRVENGNTPPSDEMTAGTGDVPFIKVYNLTRDGRLDFTVNPTFVSQNTHEDRLGRSRVLPNDVLMNIVGPPLGKVSLVPDTYPEWNMNQAIVLFRTSRVVLSRYLALCLLSGEVLRWITRTAKATAGQFNISVGNSRLLPIPLPPLAEQEQIVSLVEERLSQIDAAEKTIDSELIRSKRLRQSILKRAFEGKLVPQDPKDEPASVLLQRIKATRESEQPRKGKKTKAKAK